MSLVYTSMPLPIDAATIDVQVSQEPYALPLAVRARVDANWNSFAQKAKEKTGREPTKGGIGVLRKYSIFEDEGLEGTCAVVPFDQVLYFARTKIPEEDYAIGKQVGFPLASWALLVSEDNRALFVRKKGAEGAYENNPYSGFGALVAVDKDVREGHLDISTFLDRSVGGEVGSALWQRKTGAWYMGMNSHDENSSKVNNGYDLVCEVWVDATAEQVLANLTEDAQFASKKEAKLVVAEPTPLREFAECQSLTHSGIIGLFSYISSKFGIEEAHKQYECYKKSGKAPALEFRVS